MNFLAHAYLSFGNKEALIGNMISDFVKGSSKNSYSNLIQKGIVLHRNIDAFTDQHSITHKAKEIFRPYYRLYSAPIIDILFDHFLANDPSNFTDQELNAFSLYVYSTIEEFHDVLPERFRFVFQFMKKENWLYGYRTRSSMDRSLKGLAKRSSYMIESDSAFSLFNEHYNYLNECFLGFFPDVKQFTKERMKELFS